MAFLDTTPIHHFHVLHPLHAGTYSILRFTPGRNQGKESEASGRHCKSGVRSQAVIHAPWSLC